MKRKIYVRSVNRKKEKFLLRCVLRKTKILVLNPFPPPSPPPHQISNGSLLRPFLACSRLSVVGDERKQGQEKKWGRTKSRPFFGSPPSFFLSLAFARPQLPRAWNRLGLSRRYSANTASTKICRKGDTFPPVGQPHHQTLFKLHCSNYSRFCQEDFKQWISKDAESIPWRRKTQRKFSSKSNWHQTDEKTYAAAARWKDLSITTKAINEYSAKWRHRRKRQTHTF